MAECRLRVSEIYIQRRNNSRKPQSRLRLQRTMKVDRNRMALADKNSFRFIILIFGSGLATDVSNSNHSIRSDNLREKTSLT